MLFYLAQAVGVCGMALAVASFQQRKRSRIAFLQMLSSVVWTAHFALLGAWSGMAMNAVGVLRGYVCARKEKGRWTGANCWPFVFSALSLAACVLTWQDWLSVLPTVAMIVTSFGLWADSPRTVRRANLPGSLLWLTYNLFSGSYPGALTECCNTTSILVAMVRLDRAKAATTT